MKEESLNLKTSLYEVVDGVLYILNKNISHLDVPYGVTKIGEGAFSGCQSLTEITLPNSVTKIGVDAFWNCSSLKKITIPNSVTEVDGRAFCACTSLTEIIIPSNVKKIRSETFLGCRLLEKITISDGVTEIGERAFFGCQLLSEITIPNSVVKINNYAFWNCSSLKKITIPNSITEIGEGAFSECYSLSEVTIQDNVTVIGNSTFSDCKSLAEITLPKSVTKIDSDAFTRCSSLKKITIPSSVTEIGIGTFDYCYSLKTITIRYDDYERLKKFIIDVDLKHIWRLYKISYEKIDIIFYGPELSKKQQKTITKLARSRKYNIIFKTNENKKEEQVSKKPDRPYEHDEEIQKLLHKIDMVCAHLSDENKKVILAKVNKLLDEYEKEIQNLKPKFNASDDPIKLSISKDIKFLKPALIANLENIIISINNQKQLLKTLVELNTYKQLLDTDVDSLSENNENIESTIKNILFLSKYLDEKRKSKAINQLTEYIDEAINTVSSDIAKKLDNNLIVENKLDVKTELNLNISKLYDEIYLEYKKIKPYKLLLDSLTSNNSEINNGTDLPSMIDSIRYAISKLSSSTYKKELEDKFSKITEKYINLIKNIIDDKELLENNEYTKIERMIREELHPLLEIINNYAYLDSYIENKSNKTNLLSQLNESTNIINGHQVVELTEENSYKIITNYIIEINNLILSNDMIDENTKETVRKKLLEIINKWSKELESNKMDTLEEYNLISLAIIRDIADIHLKLNNYIEELKYYNKYSK